MGTPAHLIGSLLTIGFAIVGLGLYLLKRGRWPRRTGNTPHCPKCDYILTGNDSGTCPECGTAFTPGSLIRGERYRHRGLAFWGFLALFLGTLLLSMTLLDAVNQIEWYHFRPLGWVLKDLGAPYAGMPQKAWTEIQRRDAAGSISASQQAAWVDQMLMDLRLPTNSMAVEERDELQRRAAKGLLLPAQRSQWVDQVLRDLDSSVYSFSKHAIMESKRLLDAGEFSPAQIAGLIELGLQAQLSTAPANHNLSSFLMNLLGQRFADHTMEKTQEKRFIANCGSFVFKTRPRVGPEDRVPFQIEELSIGPEKWQRKIELKGNWVDNHKVGENGGSTWGSMGRGAMGSSIGPQRPGHHQLRVKVTVTLSRAESMDDKNPVILYTEDRDLTGEFDVLPEGAPVKLVDHPGNALIASCINATNLIYTNGQGRPYSLDGTIEIDLSAIPVNVAFDGFARVDGKEISIGSVALASGKRSGFGIYAQTLPVSSTGQIDIILRSSEAAAKSTIDLTEIWNGEIVLKDVPIKRPATQSTTPATP